MPKDWLGRTSWKRPIFCPVGRKTLTQSPDLVLCSWSKSAESSPLELPAQVLPVECHSCHPTYSNKAMKGNSRTLLTTRFAAITLVTSSLQCFDAVGCVSGKAFRPDKEIDWWSAGVVICLGKVQLICIWLSWCPMWGRGMSFPPFPPILFTSSSFALFTFSLLLFSFALPIFFFCPSLPFLPVCLSIHLKLVFYWNCYMHDHANNVTRYPR